MEYCTGLFVWGLEVCAHLVVGGVCVAEVSGAGLRCWGLCVFVIESLRRLWVFSVVVGARCNSASNAPDDGRMYPKHGELRMH
jgi:hypothetical protein